MTPTDRRSTERLTIDVSTLPEVVFGHRGVTWWATVAFMVIEGTTVAACATAYLYLRLNAAEWPPRPASPPDLLIPTLNLVVILATIWPFRQAGHAAKRFDAAAVRRWMVIGTLFSLVATVLRWFELQALNVRWDTNAYGSAVWAVVLAHATLLLVDVFESGTIAAIFYTDRVEPKHFVDVEDAALYQYFLSLSWVPLYALVFLGPRIL